MATVRSHESASAADTEDTLFGDRSLSPDMPDIDCEGNQIQSPHTISSEYRDMTESDLDKFQLCSVRSARVSMSNSDVAESSIPTAHVLLLIAHLADQPDSVGSFAVHIFR